MYYLVKNLALFDFFALKRSKIVFLRKLKNIGFFFFFAKKTLLDFFLWTSLVFESNSKQVLKLLEKSINI